MKSFALLFFSFSLNVWAQAEIAPGRSLEECYGAALGRSEVVAQQEESIKQAEDTYHQVIGGVLPNVFGSGSYQWQKGSPAGLENQYPNPASTTKLSVTQPLFQGFKEFAGLRQAKNLIGASRYDRKQAETQLYLDVAASYFAVVSYEHDLDNIKDELNYYEKRIAELNHFISIGRSQLVDRLTAKSQQAALRGQMMQIQGQVRAQRAVLAFLTGFDPQTAVKRPSTDTMKGKDLNTYLSRIPMRPDVKAEMARVQAAEEGIPIARAGHFPTLGVQGDYYLQRTGALRDTTWDVMLLLNVPIFEGGAVSAQVEQAVSKRDQAELQVSRAKRLAEQQIRQFYENFIGDKEQYEAFKEASELSEKNYSEELKQYRLGLVTNLDVLTALTTFEESKRSFDRAGYSMLQDLEDLEAAAGFEPESSKKD